MHYNATITIDAPAEKIWKILTTPNSYPEWDPNMITLGGKIAAGETLSVLTKLAPDRAFKPKVTTFEPNKKMIWSSGMPLGLFKGERIFTLTPTGDNQVEFFTQETFSGLLLPLFKSNIPDMTQVFQDFSEGLKQYAEQ